MGLPEKRQRLIEEMSYLPDRFERFTYVVDYAKDRPSLPQGLRMDSFRVEGCQSQLWLVPEWREGRCYFQADSDSAIVKGIATIICDYFSGETPEAIVAGDVAFLREVGVDQHLSSNRRNGLGKVEERIKRFAQSCMESAG